MWLLPRRKSPLYDALQSTIDGVKPLFEDSHHFEPHVTLTSDIQVSNQAQADSVLDQAMAAAKSVDNIVVRLGKVKYGSQFFKKVYLQVIPSTEIISLAMICREQFVIKPRFMGQNKNFDALPQAEQQHMADDAQHEAGNWARATFDPHLSLVYSNIYPVDEAVKETVETRLKDLFGDDYDTRGIGWASGGMSIQLVQCEGRVEDWKVLGSRDL